MILIAMGANLPGPGNGAPRKTLEAALATLGDKGDIAVIRRSSWYESAALTPGQPAYINGVALLETELSPVELLARLLEVEREYGREKREKWASRSIDLDLIAFEDRVLKEEGDVLLTLPHEELQRRNFVLLPLSEIAPEWVHPVLGKTPHQLLAELEKPGSIRRLPD